MDRLKKILLLLLLICINNNILAQQSESIKSINTINNLINESCYLKTNTTVFVTGEKILYKVALFKKNSLTKSTLSKLAYVEMFDANNKKIFKHKVFLKEGVGYADFFIPSSTATGNYKLIAYSSLMLKGTNPESFEIDIKIINPYQLKQTDFKNSSQSEISIDEKIDDNTENKSLFTINKKIFNKREKGTITINSEKSNTIKGDYTISIRKIDSLSILFDRNNKKKFKSSIYSVSKSKLPDLRGEIISGKVISNNSSSLVNKNISLSVYGETTFLTNTKTDTNGNFNFYLDKPFSNSSIVIQLTDSDKNNYTIVYDDENNIIPKKLSFNTFELTNNLKTSIEKRSIATQIQNAYFIKTNDSIVTKNNSENFYDPLSKEYKLDDYTRFPSLKETITEILSEVYFTHENNDFKIHVMSADINNSLKLETLVLVDGILIQDINQLFEYDMESFDKINVVKGMYNYGPKLYNGIVAFTTKNKNYNVDENSFTVKPQILRPFPEKKYFNPDYAKSKESLKRIPDYRYQLLWLPLAKFENNTTEINFFTSDISGLFEIIIDGFTLDGKQISINDTFEVK